MTPLTGGNCGAIRFEVAQPFESVSYCPCSSSGPWQAIPSDGLPRYPTRRPPAV